MKTELALAPAPTSPPNKPARLASLDVMRGVTIAAMVVVNNPAVGPPYLYAQLQHSVWDGWTLADLIFPSFLFMVGMSLSFSIPTNGRLAKRAAILFALGLVVNAAPVVFSGGPLHDLRLMGVLQRIAIASVIATLIVRRVPSRYQPVVTGGILLATWAALAWIPVPGIGAGHLTPGGNLEAWVDRSVLGTAHMYQGGRLGYDPEGLLGCIPASVSVLIGYWAGGMLRRRRAAAGRLLVAGIGALVVGLAWGRVLPINKRMWTPSYVLLMGGLCICLLALVHRVVDHGSSDRGWVARPWQALGANPITVYFGSELTGAALGTFHHGTLAISTWIWLDWLRPAVGARPAAVAYALLILAMWWAVAIWMYRRRWLIRL